MLNKVMNVLILSCKTATELVEKKQVTNLSFFEGFRLKTHVLLCKACRSYEKQSLLLEKAFERILESPKSEMHCLDQTSKEKILKRIKGAS